MKIKFKKKPINGMGKLSLPELYIFFFVLIRVNNNIKFLLLL